tara:strand:- start:754 stop:894 length:141 start_codon:yes stop_codon:yes gene_type:complete
MQAIQPEREKRNGVPVVMGSPLRAIEIERKLQPEAIHCSLRKGRIG